MFKNYKRGLCVLSTAVIMITASTLNGQTVKWGIPAAYDNDDQACSDVATDGAGNVYMVGSYETEAIFDQTATIVLPNADYPSAAYTDGFLAKYDRANGNAIWAVQFAQTSPATSKNERVSAVAVYPDGLGSFNLYVVGTYTSSLTLLSWNDPATFGLSGTGQCGFIAKYNANGVVQWAYTIDGTGTDIIYDVCVTGSNVSVCGSFTGSSITCSGATQGISVNTSAGGNPGGTEAFLMHFTDGGSTANPTWARAMWASGNDAFYAMATTDNGDIIATGMLRGTGTIHTNNTTSITGVTCTGADAFVLARYSATGAYSHCLSGGGSTTGVGYYDAGLAAAIDVNGDAYIAGYFSGTCTFGSNSVNNLGAAGTHDIFIAKVSSGGICTYLRGGGTTNDGDAIQSIVVNNLASRVYVTGNFKGNLSYNGSGTFLSSYSASNIDGFLLTLNASDLTRISGGETKFGGSSHDDNGRAIAINAAEDIYIGSSVLSASWRIGSGPTLMYNTNPNGGTYEAALFRWDNSNWPAVTNSFTTTHKGIGEWWNSSVGAWKISMVGSFHSNGGNPVSFPPCTTLIASTQDASGNYSTNDAYLTTCSTFGDYESFVRLMNGNGDEAVNDHTTDVNGNNYFTGYGPTSSTQVLTFVGGSSYSSPRLNTSFVGKYDQAGNYLWGVFIAPDNSSSSVEAQGIATDNSGNVYVTGAFSGTVTFGTQPPVTSVGPGSVDIFVAKYNSSGTFQWAVTFGSKAYEKAYSISVDNAGNYYTTGEFNGQASDALTMGNTLNGSGNADIFVMKGAVSNGVAAKSIKKNSGAADIGMDVISPNSTECYITGSYNNVSQCFTGSVNFSPTTPTWNWNATSSSGSGFVSAVGTDLVMGNNGYLFVSGYATGNNTLGFGALSETVSNGAFLVSYSSWAGTPVCMEAYILPSNSLVYTEGIALETGVNSPDHGDNVLVAGSKGSVANNHEAYAHKITTEGCVVSERLANPFAITSTESSLYNSVVYPNPLNSNAVLELVTDADFSAAPYTFVITDMTGREISRTSGLTTKRVDINAEYFASGLYYYQVIQDNKMISTGKMVVSH